MTDIIYKEKQKLIGPLSMEKMKTYKVVSSTDEKISKDDILIRFNSDNGCYIYNVTKDVMIYDKSNTSDYHSWNKSISCLRDFSIAQIVFFTDNDVNPFLE